MQTRFLEIRKALQSAVGRKHSFGAGGNSEEFHQIRSSLSEMKSEIDHHNAAMSQIIDDQNKKQLHLESLYGHVDQLENAKADRQQINRDIEVKADRKELERKISRDKFHNSLSSLDQSVQDLVEKLVGHVSRFWPTS
jgi:chromosome segregation ATPase